LTQDQKVFVKRVKSNIDRLARLINDVLDLTKLESGKMVMNLLPLRVEAVIQEVIETQESLVKAKGLTIAAEFGENLPILIADKDRLIQVFNNLINNALKFTIKGGIVIAVHSEDKGSLTFSVRDTGVGIKKEDLSKLFQKFQQVGAASQQVAGTGLGLAICRLIIARHRGRIWVESQFGKGSTVLFQHPYQKEKTYSYC
jgi:signal transduction histidine kinase